MWAHWLLTCFFIVAVLSFTYIFMIRPYSYRWKPCYGSKEYEICMPHRYNLFGIDVSHHQGTIDWKSVADPADRTYPIRFVFMKATEGGSFLDQNYQTNMAEARKTGLICGAYHFFNPETSGSRQADFFIENVTLEKGDLPPVLDVERRGSSRTMLQSEVLEWLRAVEHYYGVKPIIYASYKFRKNYLDSPEFDDYVFWMAHYYVETPASDAEWLFWQFSDRAVVPGIAERTDINVFSGDLSQLESLRMRTTVLAKGLR